MVKVNFLYLDTTVENIFLLTLLSETKKKKIVKYQN